jgi:fatty acid CoA ligase FadD22
MNAKDSGHGNFAARLLHEAEARGAAGRRAYIVNGRSYTYGDVSEGVRRAASVLTENGVGPGDSVLLILPDGMELISAFLGAAWIGAVPVPVNYELHPAELARAARIASPKVLVAGPGHESAPGTPLIPVGELSAGTGSHAEVPPWPCDPETPAYAVLTSGTTGEPRLCVHTHGDPYAIHESFGAAMLRLTEQDISYCVSRMYFSFGLCNSIFYPQFSGATAVLEPTRPAPQDALRAIRDLGVTVLNGQPSFYARLLDTEGVELLDRVRLAVVAGELLSAPLEEKLRGLLGDRLINVLGASEVGNVFACAPPGTARPGWVGPVLPPYQMRVVDEHGREGGVAAEGRLQVLGPTVTFRVTRYGDEVRHGPLAWWPSGDMAVIDDDGYVRVLGRADDIEILGGVNVHPAEIEDLLMRHPLVREAAVCAVRGGGPTRLRAYVVPRPGAASPSAVEDLRAVASSQLTWYKVPEEVVFVPELPRTPTGKLNRRRLREMANC